MKKIKTLKVSLLILSFLLLSGCGKHLDNYLIVGEWEGTDDKTGELYTMTFYKSLKFSFKHKSFKFQNDKVMSAHYKIDPDMSPKWLDIKLKNKKTSYEINEWYIYKFKGSSKMILRRQLDSNERANEFNGNPSETFKLTRKRFLLSDLLLYFSNSYEGEYKNRKKHGWGTYKYVAGDLYEGEWKDDKRHGWGTYKWANGKSYVGEWKDGKCHGKGTMKWADGDSHIGKWQDGMPNGQGTWEWADGSTSKGFFQNGKREGFFVTKFSNGNKYNGNYKDDTPNGKGKYFWKSGEIIDVHFEANIGTAVLPNGAKYEGDWSYGLPDGKGKITKADRTVLIPVEGKGKFEKGKMVGSFTETKPDGTTRTVKDPKF